MSGPITWRSVGGPNVGNPSQSMALATNAFRDAFSGLGQALNEQNAVVQQNWDKGKEANTNAFLARLAEFQTPEEAAKAMPALRQELGGFGAQIDGVAARNALGSLQETLQRRAIAAQQFEQGVQAHKDWKTDQADRPFLENLQQANLEGTTDQGRANLLAAVRAGQEAGALSSRGAALATPKITAQTDLLVDKARVAAKDVRDQEAHVANLENMKRDDRRADAQLRLSQLNAARDGERLGLDRIRAGADLVGKMESRLADVTQQVEKGVTELTTQQKDFQKNSPFSGGSYKDTDAASLLQVGKAAGVTPDAVSSFIKDLNKEFPSGKVKLPGSMTEVPISKGMVEAAIVEGANMFSWFPTDGNRGELMTMALKKMVERPDFVSKYEEYTAKNNLYSEQVKALKQQGQEAQGRIRNAFTPYLDAVTGGSGSKK